jgi:hypothetical protein
LDVSHGLLNGRERGTSVDCGGGHCRPSLDNHRSLVSRSGGRSRGRRSLILLISILDCYHIDRSGLEDIFVGRIRAIIVSMATLAAYQACSSRLASASVLLEAIGAVAMSSSIIDLLLDGKLSILFVR